MVRWPGRSTDPVDPAVTAAREQVRFRRRIILGVVAVVLLIVGYFVAAAFLPRWWARQVAGWVQDSFTRGLLYGLAFGLVFTLVPLLILASAFWRRLNQRVRAGVILLAIVVSVPNLMTLGISTGTGSGAHAGGRIMDDRAPFFQGATLLGAILAVILFGLAWWQRRAGRRVRAAKRSSKEQRQAGTTGSAGSPGAGPVDTGPPTR